MTTGATGQLGLALPVQGELSGTWGDTVNNGITQYTNIAIAATLTLTNDGAVTLANTTGDASASNITSTLTGAGTVTAQFAIVRVTGTLTVAKVVTGPSYSKTYVVDNAATGGIVTFKAAGQSGVSIAVGEKCSVYFNGTDYVKVASSTTDGVSTIDFGSTGLTPNTATSGAVTVAGTLAIANGGTGTTSTTFANLTANVTGTLPVANGGTGITSLGAGVATFLGTPSSANLASAVTDETGTGALVFATSPTLVTPALGTPASGVLSSCTVDGTNAVGYRNIPQSGAAKTTGYTLAVGDIGEFIEVGASGSIVVPDATFAAGDAVVIFNNTSGAITLTMSITTAYIGGTDADKATISLATRGLCNVLFISGTVCVVTGNVT